MENRKKSLYCLATLALALVISGPLQAQDPPIVEIPFESIPDGTQVQAAGGITLDGNVAVNQNLTAQGVIESAAGGFKFPDGSVQTTASSGPGIYNNRIVLMTPAQPFSEVCFKQGSIFGDIHVSSESSAGGNCLPGDVGYIIERNQRTAARWENAQVQCLLDGMRLPETFEWLYSCYNAATFGLNEMVGDWEWASSVSIPLYANNISRISVSKAGLSGCSFGSFDSVAQGNGAASIFPYHCVR